MAGFKNLISTTADSISSGGTISGDVTISGDLTVTGGGGFAFTEVISASDSGAVYTQYINSTTGSGAGSGTLFGIGASEESQIWNYRATHMVFATADTERMRIDSAGNVGIGTTAPGSSAGANALDIRDTNTSSATQGASLRLGSNDGAVMGATHRMGVIEFAGAEDGGGTMVAGARIDAFAVDAFTATGTYDHSTKLQFSVQDGTSGTDQLASPAMVLDANSRISLSNNDASGAVGTTLFGYNAGLNIVSGCIDNTFIGHAGADATLTNAADYNTGVGGSSLSSLTS